MKLQNGLVPISVTHPHLLSEWDYSENEKVGVRPDNVSKGSSRKVFWQCKKNMEHVWESPVYYRTSGKQECPYCSGRRVTSLSSFAAHNPDKVKEWDFEKNVGITPETVTYGSAKEVWWKCSKGHSYLMRVLTKTYNNKCPYCRGMRVCHDNSLAFKFPELAQEWHPTLNKGLTPSDVPMGSHKLITWQCRVDPDHVWVATVNNRVTHQSGCPHCNSIFMKDGGSCASIPEAIKYIEYREKGLVFEHNKKYPSLGQCRYDFFFPQENKYVEVTSYNQKTMKVVAGWYFSYLRRIVEKRRYVQNILKAQFEFIQFIPTNEQRALLKGWVKAS